MKYLIQQQVLGLLKAARAESERDFLMVLLAYRHGLRASEVCALTTKDFADGYITIKRLKGSLKTVHPLFSSDNPLLDEKRAVTAWLKDVPKGGRLFPITRQHFHRLFQAYCVQAGIPKPMAHPHTLKHSAAMHLVKKVGIEELRQFIGHKSLSSTGQYLKVSDQAACKAVVAALAGE
jgi:type 1 fimbriae regulatory protein FimB/type 1 fimbriae regulatory protein FimE